MKAYRASLLWFAPSRNGETARAQWEDDGLLVVGPNALGVQVVQAIGAHRDVVRLHPEVPVEHWSGRIIAPGFVDLHLHYPQTNVIGSPADGLLPWLENYTFPEEKRFEAPEYCAQAATFFIAELLRNGVTTALTFATSHTASVNALFAHWDALLAPATPVSAPFIGTEWMDINGTQHPARAAMGLLTQPISFAGCPVVAAPLWPSSSQGMPIGVQLIAAPWREDLALRAALALQNAGVAHLKPVEI